mmetsp:Transcript_12791/g.37543  ORF Transcript_12791/g.37543 Transcript_12791/m.37543 type:complete len:335 (-) Transcript_12791:309-1313(-)
MTSLLTASPRKNVLWCSCTWVMMASSTCSSRAMRLSFSGTPVSRFSVMLHLEDASSPSNRDAPNGAFRRGVSTHRDCSWPALIHRGRPLPFAQGFPSLRLTLMAAKSGAVDRSRTTRAFVGMIAPPGSRALGKSAPSDIALPAELRQHSRLELREEVAVCSHEVHALHGQLRQRPVHLHPGCGRVHPALPEVVGHPRGGSQVAAERDELVVAAVSQIHLGAAHRPRGAPEEARKPKVDDLHAAARAVHHVLRVEILVRDAQEVQRVRGAREVIGELLPKVLGEAPVAHGLVSAGERLHGDGGIVRNQGEWLREVLAVSRARVRPDVRVHALLRA